jgi:hypothetical protein
MMAHPKDYLSRPYVKAKIQAAGSNGPVTRIVWGERISKKVLRIVDREGVWTGEFFVGAPADFIWIKEARLNRYYGELEVLS